MCNTSISLCLLTGFLLSIDSSSSALHAATEQLWVTDSGGRHLYTYEVPRWRLIDRMEVGNQAHGICATADGQTVYLSLEGSNELVRVDTKTRTINGRVAVGPAPNEIECTPDGSFVYVPCASGHWWIIDGVDMKVVGKIKTRGRPHNTLIGPNSRYMYLAPLQPANEVTVVDLENHTVEDKIQFSAAPRPGAIAADSKILVHQVDNLMGFEVASLESRRLLKQVSHDLAPELGAVKSRCHGLAIRPDQAEVWSANVNHRTVHVHEIGSGDFKQTDAIAVDGAPYWISFSQDGAFAFVSLVKEQSQLQPLREAGRVTALIGVGTFVLLPIWFHFRRNAATSRARNTLWCFVAGLTLCWGTTLVLFVYVKTVKGHVAVIDSETKELVARLDGGRIPKRTQAINVPSTEPELSETVSGNWGTSVRRPAHLKVESTTPFRLTESSD